MMNTTKRCYTFSVYITADEQTEDAGYDAKEITDLLKRTLNYYDAPLNKERRFVTVDYELMDSEPVTEKK
jgi:hypothetical protein